MNSPYKLDYLFTAEAMNGNIIKQNLDDKSILNLSKSAFYDVMQNLPLKKFALSGRGHTFVVDFTDLSISIDERKHFCPRPPEGSRVTPIYYRKVVQVAKHTPQVDKTLISHFKKFFVESKHAGTLVQYKIGFQIHTPNGKNKKYEMTIE